MRSRASWEAKYSSFDAVYGARVRWGLPAASRSGGTFQAIRALPRGVRGKRETLEGESDADLTLKEEKSLKPR